MPFIKVDGKWVDSDVQENLAKYPIKGPESIMSDKGEHGTTATPLQHALRWECDHAQATKYVPLHAARAHTHTQTHKHTHTHTHTACIGLA